MPLHLPLAALPIPTIPSVLQPYLISSSPFRGWAMLLALCVFLCVFKGTRRLGAFGFFGVAGAMTLFMGLESMVSSVVPR